MDRMALGVRRPHAVTPHRHVHPRPPPLRCPRPPRRPPVLGTIAWPLHAVAGRERPIPCLGCRPSGPRCVAPDKTQPLARQPRGRATTQRTKASCVPGVTRRVPRLCRMTYGLISAPGGPPRGRAREDYRPPQGALHQGVFCVRLDAAKMVPMEMAARTIVEFGWTAQPGPVWVGYLQGIVCEPPSPNPGPTYE